MNVNDVIDQIRSGYKPTVGDVEILLNAEGRDKETLFENAREVRDKQFGDKLFAYGFVYFSTYCRNNCSFCYFRKSNDIDRYRKSKEELIDLSMDLVDAGIDLVDLTMGEDVAMYDNGYSKLTDIVSAVHNLGISVMVSPGAVEKEAMPKLKAAGADFFAVYQETYNRDLYAKLRLNQDFDFRYNQRVWAHQAGILTEDGLLVGLGESVKDLAESMLEMGREPCEQIRAMTFVPQAGTPMQAFVPHDSEMELKFIAAARIMFPERFIPASLDVEGVEGMKSRLNAGASTITSIIAPKRHLAGVAQPEKDIESGTRGIEHVYGLVDELGKRVATKEEFSSLIATMKPKQTLF